MNRRDEMTRSLECFIGCDEHNDFIALYWNLFTSPVKCFIWIFTKKYSVFVSRLSYFGENNAMTIYEAVYRGVICVPFPLYFISGQSNYLFPYIAEIIIIFCLGCNSIRHEELYAPTPNSNGMHYSQGNCFVLFPARDRVYTLTAWASTPTSNISTSCFSFKRNTSLIYTFLFSFGLLA